MGAQDREDHTSDIDMDRGSSPPATLQGSSENGVASTEPATPKAKQQDTGTRHKERNSVDLNIHHSDPKAVSQTAPSDETSSTLSDSIFQHPSTTSTSATSIIPAPARMPQDQLPSIDEQVAKIFELSNKALHDKQKGYVVSCKWLYRVWARSSDPPKDVKHDKSATEGEIGPVDNSDLVLVTESSGDLLDEEGKRFVALKPGLQMNEDYHIIPEEAWNLILQWYGMLETSPVITRFVHDTSIGDVENCVYELQPPIFSLLKLTTPNSGFSIADEAKPPARLMVSSSQTFNSWLKTVKKLVGIDTASKVRVWKILGRLKSSSGSGMLTPAASRSSSPAPGANIVASAGDSLVVDLGTFTALHTGDERELLDVKDETMNPKYNGTRSLNLAGLGKDEVILLEEQIGGPGGGEWPSDNPKAGGLLGVSKSGAAAEKVKGRGLTPSGRSSPGPGMMTRGRQKKDGRPRGITGLANLGNTCYMNSALQCVRSVEELTQFFLHDEYKHDLNPSNPLGHHGEVAKAYAALLTAMYAETNTNAFSPVKFKSIVGKYGPNFSGYGQQDSQEFLLFLLDGLQEDLNRIHRKPYIEKPDSTDEMVHDPVALKGLADRHWEIYKARNDSIITDLFAGMYKSTLICPVCDKVSIIFDPFNNLTLQLPIENNWAKEVYFFPLHDRPIRVDVDIDKNASIRSLKEFVAIRVHSDADRMVMAESYKSKFYKMFDNITTIAEANIQTADQICLYELDSIPTNYNPNKAKKHQFTYTREPAEMTPDPDSPAADRLLVPLFHRVQKSASARNPQRVFFGEPGYIIITREDAQDYNEILRKVLTRVATMTTRRILQEDNSDVPSINTPEDPDTVVMQDDDHSSDSNQVQTKSVEGGFVNISMKNADEPFQSIPGAAKTAQEELLKPGSFIPPMLQNLFQLKAVKTGEVIPLGWQHIEESKDYPSISARAYGRLPHRPAKSSKINGATNGVASSVSSEEDDDTLPTVEIMPDDEGSDAGSTGLEKQGAPSGSESDEDLPSAQSIFSVKTGARRNNAQVNRVGRKAKKSQPKPTVPEAKGPLLLPGEALLLDWSWDAYEALFDGTEYDENEMRGAPTWRDISKLEDKELIAKRLQRQTRRRNGISLDDCLNEFGKMETLSENNAWYCPRCKEHRRASKKFELWKIPDILVMHLKRFSSNRSFRDKLEIFVDYPVEGLDMTDKIIMNEENKSLIYDLIAVDNHYGGLGGGHYTAYAQNFFDKGWYEYNDTHASRRNDPSSVVTPAAYLLFYRRRSTHPLGGPKMASFIESLTAPPAAAGSNPGSRDVSPNALAGEGLRLADSSHIGSSSAFTAAAAAHHVGDGGVVTITTNPQATARQVLTTMSNMSSSAARPAGAVRLRNSDEADADDEDLPDYENSHAHMLVSDNVPHGVFPPMLMSGGMDMRSDHHLPHSDDEAIDIPDADHPYGPRQPWEDDPGWGFSALDNHQGLSGRGVSSQMMAAPPGSLDLNEDEDGDLFAGDDGASTKAEGGLSDAGSDADQRMRELGDLDDDVGEEMMDIVPLLGRGSRESAPPPLPPPRAREGEDEDEDEDEDGLPVQELKND